MNVINVGFGSRKWQHLRENATVATLTEALSDKAIDLISRRVEENGSRETAVWIVDQILTRKIGLSSSDLPDTSTFANGLDGISDDLENGDPAGAFETAKELATDMLEEEGFGF